MKVEAGVFDFGYLIVEKIAHAKSAMGERFLRSSVGTS
jgi:hypothetical protein